MPDLDIYRCAHLHRFLFVIRTALQMMPFRWLTFIFFFHLVLTVSVGAQDVSYTRSSDLPEKRKNQYSEAVRLIRLGNWKDGMQLMSKVLEKYPDCIDCHIQQGAALFDNAKYGEALPYLEKVVQLDPDYRPVAWVVLAQTYFHQERYPDARNAFERFVATDPKEGEWLQKTRFYLHHIAYAETAYLSPVAFDVIPITGKINSPLMEYHPSLTADGKVLVFTRKSSQQEDLFVSTWKGAEWSEGKLLEGVNTLMNEGAHCISADGRTIVYTACGRREGFGSCDLYISDWTGERWTEPRNLGPQINTESWESMPSLSANGQWLYFSSNRRGGQGGNDIWVSRRKADGEWTIPFNAGPRINTRFDEESPFIHPDGRSLYFMSEGHPGFGGQDIFLSRLNEQDEWGIPVNLGYPINTSDDEGGLSVNLTGDTGYIFTNRPAASRTDPNTTGQLDIIAFAMPRSSRPSPVTYLELTVLDQRSRTPLSATIDIHELPRDEFYSSGTTDGMGTFLICLPAEKDYLFRISSPGYVYHSYRIPFQDVRGFSEPLKREVLLVPVSPGDTLEDSGPVVLENIFFESGSARLKSSSQFELDGLAAFLRENPESRIEVRGHTDNVGSEEDNLTLSLERAKSVYDALILRGIAPARLSYRGFGETMPVAENETDEGRSKNRRTEFIILR